MRSECNEVIVKRDLVDEADLTGEIGHMMTVNRTLRRVSIARIEVDTPFYTTTFKTICIKIPCLT